MYKLVPVVGKIMNSFYPEVENQTDFIQKVIRTEEERFHETLNEGLAILETIIKMPKKQTNKLLKAQISSNYMIHLVSQ